MCLGLLIMGGYLWANYLRLEHYLLVPWLLLAILAAAGLDGLARAVMAALTPARAAAPPDLRWVPVSFGVASILLAAGLAWSNAKEYDRSGDNSGREYVGTLYAHLEPRAVVVSGWDFSTPLWYATFVEGQRTDITIIDDSNIVYDGWQTRENAVAAFICSRPVYAIRYDDNGELGAMRQLYSVTPVVQVFTAWGGPTATSDKTVWRIAPRPGTCPGS
jgi:hypothetical protein